MSISSIIKARRGTISSTKVVVTPPPPGTIFIAGGTYGATAFETAINAQSPSGPIIVKPVTGQTVIVTEGYAPHRQYLTFDGIVFDGQGITPRTWMPQKKFWTYKNCTFKRFWTTVPGDHTEALYLGGDCSDGVIDSCLFDDNGTTGHIFFTWFGGDLSAPSPEDEYPDRICVKNCVFTNSHNAPYYDIQFRAEIPLTAQIYIDPSNAFEYSVTPPGFIRPCPS